MLKDNSGEKVETENRLSIKAELVDEVLKEYRGPQGSEAIFKHFRSFPLGNKVSPADPCCAGDTG